MSEPTNNNMSTNWWNEGDSATFLDFGEIFVPKRAEQIETLVQLIPAHSDETFTIVELAAGGGVLAQAILEHFPRCHYVALDGSAKMRGEIANKLAHFRDRLTIAPFLLEEQAWRTTLPSPLRCVVSSLCVHHLLDAGKQNLFRDMAAQLEAGGALLLADIIKPATPHIASLFAQQYDAIVRTQSIAAHGDLSGYEHYQMLQWNYFTYDYNDPDSYDYPSLLSEQLRWLNEVGFTYADCFWMQAGHAVYGGYK